MLALDDGHWERFVRTLGLASNGSVLDVGCGSGAWLIPLSRLNNRVVAVDPFDEAVESAREASRSSESVEVRQMPAENLDFADASFDTVTCMTVLPYLAQPAGVREMARVLKPNGRLIIGSVGYGYYAKHVVEGIRANDLASIRYGIDPITVSMARAIAGDTFAPGSLRCWSPRAVRRILAEEGVTLERSTNNVDAINPQWPPHFLWGPTYFIVWARKRAE